MAAIVKNATPEVTDLFQDGRRAAMFEIQMNAINWPIAIRF
jgi:hypothetical protein